MDKTITIEEGTPKPCALEDLQQATNRLLVVGAGHSIQRELRQKAERTHSVPADGQLLLLAARESTSTAGEHLV